MNGSLQDLRFAWRALRRAPGFALGVVAVLALGIGANTAMFTVLRSTLLRPLGYRKPGELVVPKAQNVAGEEVWLRSADALAWGDRNHSLAGLAYYDTDGKTLDTGRVQQQVGEVSVSANLFALLGVGPELGHGFVAGDQQPGRGNEVVLSDAVWRNQFGADPQVLGRIVHLDDNTLTVVGVMPRGFVFPADRSQETQVWRPLTVTPAALSRRMDEAEIFSVIARRRPEFRTEQVAAELSAIQSTLVPLYAGQGMAPEILPARVTAVGYRESLDGKQRQATLALTGAVALLWLIACADIASLSLARATARGRETAVRAALGASRWHLLRRGWAEALLLSVGGGALGFVLSEGILALLRHRLVQTFGTGFAWHADGVVLLNLCGLTLLSALIFGTIPVVFASGSSLEQPLRADGVQAGTGRQQQRLQKLLVVGELALTLSLLVGCGLLLRTVLALRQVPLGFRTDHVVSITPHLLAFKYGHQDTQALVLKPLADRLRALPGVQSVAITSVAPLSGRFDVNFVLNVTGKSSHASHGLQAKLRAAEPDLQRVLGFGMKRGRFFDPALDTPTSQPVAVVNRAFEKLYAPSGDVLNFQLGDGDKKFKIIGVVNDFHQQGVAEAPAPEIDLNAAQMSPKDGFYQPTLQAHAEILLRSSRDPASLLPELRHALEATNPDLAGADIQTMDQIVEDAMGSQLLAAHLLELLGGLALLVALTGLYSLLAYLVTLRTRELGVRLALGAQRRDILTLVLRGAGGLLVLGALFGLAFSLAASHLLGRFLFGVQAYDLDTFATATLALLLVGLLAAWLPAHRASAIQPTEALRTE